MLAETFLKNKFNNFFTEIYEYADQKNKNKLLNNLKFQFKNKMKREIML